ncbi:MAG: D-alanyl-D-alanine carboxypeptidase/D-alanyl-D-alanine-endopeptidase [Prochloron sp. SP5CPC1]|nr:D-alanyl-D-alanine carboxypeptidase/D-alanyl-D-alanine-endopeptidase [Candidatus Paraprochloron terpiosi SP5CPC1]
MGGKIDKFIQEGGLDRSSWGILVQNLHSEEILYSRLPQQYFLPASNAKILTTTAALLKFGAYFQITTPIYTTGNIPHLTSLRIVGRGDPSFTTATLQDLATELEERGVTRIDELIIEDSYFPSGGINPTWEWEDVYSYWGVSVTSLILNENAVTLTLFPGELGDPVRLEWGDIIAGRQWEVENKTVTGSEGTPYGVKINPGFGERVLHITGELGIDVEEDIWGLAVPDPAGYFLNTFHRVLLERGIEIGSGVVTHDPREHYGVPFLEITSPPLSLLLQKTNTESNNLYAETLFQLLGGEEGVEEVLTGLGVASDSYALVDGSGLSRHNLLTPKGIVDTLRLIAGTQEWEVFRESLPVAGVSGTLPNRFMNTKLFMQAKTGTLTGVSALSGYLTIPGGETLVFSIMVNHSPESVRVLRRAMDDLVLLFSCF